MAVGGVESTESEKTVSAPPQEKLGVIFMKPLRTSILSTLVTVYIEVASAVI